MKTNKNRRSIRLRGYDYSQTGWYFITICISGFEELLGKVSADGQFTTNEIGQIVEDSWLETPNIRPTVVLDAFQVMPNHFHAIVVIGDRNDLPNIIGFPDVSNPPTTFKSPAKTIGSIVRGFKGSSTRKIRIVNHNLGNKIWQSNYYERIVRDENELLRIRKYIETNPSKWQEDKEFFKKLLKKMTKR